MRKGILLVTSTEGFLRSLVENFKLSKKNDVLYSGEVENKDLFVFLVGNSKIDSTLSLTSILSTTLSDKISKIVIVNPIQCPDISIKLGDIVIATSVSEWDKSILDTVNIPLSVPNLDKNFILGRCLSGDRLCINKTTPILQVKFIDTITFPISKVARYFKIPLLSIGVVVDYCTPRFSGLLQSNINELSFNMIDFIKRNSFVLLGE